MLGIDGGRAVALIVIGVYIGVAVHSYISAESRRTERDWQFRCDVNRVQRLPGELRAGQLEGAAA